MTTKPIHKTEERLIAQARKDVGTMMAARVRRAADMLAREDGETLTGFWRAADMLAREDGETLTGFFAQYVRDRLKKRGLTLADPRFDPKEKS